MNENLKKLVKLQAVDLKIRELEISAEEFPAQIRDFEAKIAQKQKRVDDIQSRLTAIETESKNLNERVETAQSSLSRSEERLSAIATNREYDAVHAEIEAQKHTVSTAQKRREAIDEDRKRLEDQLCGANDELEQVRSENQQPIEELKEKLSSIDSRVAIFVAERNALIPGIERPFVRTYEHIHSHRKRGNALSMVNVLDRTCSVCHMVLEPQLFNDVRKGNRMLLCQSCGSILVWEDDALEQTAPSEESSAS
jgi:predicted  nucleic acid-binding Zn-ribbon protein